MKLCAPRYTERPFPAYRFIPGQDPHPTADPAGHSFLPPEQAHPEVTFYPPDQWQRSQDYLYGCDLYNHGYWWEAHEAWEGLWQLTDKKALQGRFLQALIQVSARHLKLHMHKQRGIESLGTSSAGHIRFVLDHLSSSLFMGLNFPRWVTRVEHYYEKVLGGEAAHPQHDPQCYPYIKLE